MLWLHCVRPSVRLFHTRLLLRKQTRRLQKSQLVWSFRRAAASAAYLADVICLPLVPQFPVSHFHSSFLSEADRRQLRSWVVRRQDLHRSTHTQHSAWSESNDRPNTPPQLRRHKFSCLRTTCVCVVCCVCVTASSQQATHLRQLLSCNQSLK